MSLKDDLAARIKQALAVEEVPEEFVLVYELAKRRLDRLGAPDFSAQDLIVLLSIACPPVKSNPDGAKTDIKPNWNPPAGKKKE